MEPIDSESDYDNRNLVDHSSLNIYPQIPEMSGQGELCRPSNAASIEERNLLLRSAAPHEIYDVALSVGLTKTQAGILKAISGEKPHFSNIARAYGVSSVTVANWARIIGAHGTGRKAQASKLSDEQERAIKQALRVARSSGTPVDLKELHHKTGVSITTLKIRSRKAGVIPLSSYGAKSDTVKKALQDVQGPINLAVLARQLEVSPRLISNHVKGPEAREAPQSKKVRGISFSTRQTVLDKLVEANSSFHSIARSLGLQVETVQQIAHEYETPSRRAVCKPINKDLMLRAADEIIKRRLESASRPDVKPIVERYVGLLPLNTLKEIALKYTDQPLDDFAATRVSRYFSQLSDQQVCMIVAGSTAKLSPGSAAVIAASHFAALPQDMASLVAARRLNTLPDPDIHPLAKKYIQASSKSEIRELVVGYLRRGISPNDKDGIIGALKAIRPLPASSAFVDAALSHFLNKAGVHSADDLQSRSDQKILALDVPTDLYAGLHYALFACGAVLNRKNIHRREGKKGGATAPDRNKLEKLARLALS